MKIHQIYTENSLRNFNYIIACDNSKEALVVDPLRVDLIMALVNKNGYNVSKIINTHEHADHTDGNQELVSLTGAQVYCHQGAVENIPCAEFGLSKDDVISVGETVNIAVLDTPGHTMAHICLLASDKNNINNKAIFSGDTLFNAGAGNVYSGNVDSLYNTFVNILFKLPDDTSVYPGHDYLENNLNFTLSREPSNSYATDLLSAIKDQDPTNPLVTTLAQEKQMNTFFRLSNAEIIKHLNNELKGNQQPSEKEVFIALRDLRNCW